MPTSGAEVAIVFTLTLWMRLVGATASGWLADRIGRKKPLMISIAWFSVCNLFAGLAPSFWLLLLFRTALGIGMGAEWPAGAALAMETWPQRSRGFMGSVLQGSWGLGALLSSAAYALLFDSIGWLARPAADRRAARPGDRLHPQIRQRTGGLDREPAQAARREPRVPRTTVQHLQAGRARQYPHGVLDDGQRVRRRLLGWLGGGQLRWTTVGILSGVCCGTAYFLISVLLPKALVDQGAAVSVGFGLSSLVFFASIPGKAFTGFLMEIIGRRWTIAYALAGSLPGLLLMLMAHWAGDYATVVMVAGALITGFTVLSAFTAVRVYLSEQFPTALRGRGHIFGESVSRLFAGVLAPFLMEPHTSSPTIFFGTILVVVAIGAFIPLLFGRETVGQLETVTERVPARLPEPLSLFCPSAGALPLKWCPRARPILHPRSAATAPVPSPQAHPIH